MNKPILIDSYSQVMQNVRTFSEEVHFLVDRLSQFRLWYYVPEVGAVGPSKFIGYSGMTAKVYLDRGNREGSPGTNLDGRKTMVTLERWFRQTEPGTPEHERCMKKVIDLLRSYNKIPSSRARYMVPLKVQS